MERPLVRGFSEIGATDVPLVGGSNASSGVMRRQLSTAGLRVPHGWAGARGCDVVG